MKLMKLFMALALVAAFAGAAQAWTIAVVSDAKAPDPAGLKYEQNDDSLVAFLEGLGYTVDTSAMGGAARGGPTAGVLAADLVIVSRRTNSGDYANGTEEIAWNELAQPLILQSGHLTRDSRWGWTTTGAVDADRTATDLQIVGAHPFLPDPVIFDWTGSPAGEAPFTVYLPEAGAVVDGTVIAEFDGLPFLIDYAAGTDLGAAYGVLGERRAFLGHWGYDDTRNSSAAAGSDGLASDWEDYITDDYKDLFAQTIATMIPEPATFVILGLGGLLLRRRR